MFQVEEEKRNNDPRAYAPRADWDSFDPNLIAEGLFAAANIFSSLKVHDSILDTYAQCRNGLCSSWSDVFLWH